jgi:hypothetical protein
MSKIEKMAQVEKILEKAGIYQGNHYIWSMQGPTLIYLGTKDLFRGLTVGNVQEIKDLGVEFLVEP